MGDREVLRGVKEDVDRKRFHIACNRVFEWAHRGEMRRVKEEGLGAGVPGVAETIVHPNTYFKRSYMLRNLDKVGKGAGMGEVEMEV